MDSEKIGKFIYELRIEKNLTQEQLADKIHVANKAISKWERGLDFSDIYLLEPLSNELGVSILEILKCEHTKDNIQDDRQDINILLNTLTKLIHEKKIKKRIMIFTVSLIILISIFIFYIARRFNGIHQTFFAGDYHIIFEPHGIFFPIPFQSTFETIRSWIYDPSTIDIIGFIINIINNIVISILISIFLLSLIKNKKKYILLTIIISFILELGKWLLRIGIYDADDIIIRIIIGILTFNFIVKVKL